jgi:hypothetical protein
MSKLRERLAELRVTRRRQAKRRDQYARKHRTMVARVKRTSGRIKRLRARIVSANAPVGDRIVAAAATWLGMWETDGPNDAPWLRAMEAVLVKAGAAIGWMIPRNPYCGMGVMAAVFKATGVLLPDGMVYTPNILDYAGLEFVSKTTGKRYRLVRVALSNAKPGAIVVCDFDGGGADHVCIARGPLRGGVMPTRDFNTSPTNSGSQANGGGVYDRARYAANLLGALELRPIN